MYLVSVKSYSFPNDERWCGDVPKRARRVLCTSFFVFCCQIILSIHMPLRIQLQLFCTKEVDFSRPLPSQGFQFWILLPFFPHYKRNQIGAGIWWSRKWMSYPCLNSQLSLLKEGERGNKGKPLFLFALAFLCDYSELPKDKERKNEDSERRSGRKWISSSITGSSPAWHHSFLLFMSDSKCVSNTFLQDFSLKEQWVM